MDAYFLENYEYTNKIAVLWEKLEILLNKYKSYYREIRSLKNMSKKLAKFSMGLVFLGINHCII